MKAPWPGRSTLRREPCGRVRWAGRRCKAGRMYLQEFYWPNRPQEYPGSAGRCRGDFGCITDHCLYATHAAVGLSNRNITDLVISMSLEQSRNFVSPHRNFLRKSVLKLGHEPLLRVKNGELAKTKPTKTRGVLPEITHCYVLNINLTDPRGISTTCYPNDGF